MRSPTSSPTSGPRVSIHVDATTAAEGPHEHSLCELDDGTPIPVSTMHRFLCDAMVRAVIIEPDGTVRRVAEMRTPNRAQRRALAAMYSTCAHPDCTVPVTRCQAHHIVWYSKHGPTLLDNLIPLCSNSQDAVPGAALLTRTGLDVIEDWPHARDGSGQTHSVTHVVQIGSRRVTDVTEWV